LPERSTAMLVAYRKGRLLLSRRPETGIWGGLWSLPECDADLNPIKACQQLGLTAKTTKTLAEFLHVFTHYRLTIRPHLVDIIDDHTPKTGSNQRSNNDLVWVAIQNLHNFGLPSPVRKLLDGLIEAKLLAQC
jgi:A/G-specific adenine glycosylase